MDVRALSILEIGPIAVAGVGSISFWMHLDVLDHVLFTIISNSSYNSFIQIVMTMVEWSQ